MRRFGIVVNRPYCNSIGKLLVPDSDDIIPAPILFTLPVVEFVLLFVLLLPPLVEENVLLLLLLQLIAEDAVAAPVLPEVMAFVDYKCK